MEDVQRRADGKVLYRNQSAGIVGVFMWDAKGNEKSLPVAPGETVWLSDEEVELTEAAHKSPTTSPFRDQEYVVRDEEDFGNILERGHRPPLVPVLRPAAAVAGSFSEGEETGDPAQPPVA